MSDKPPPIWLENVAKAEHTNVSGTWSKMDHGVGYPVNGGQDGPTYLCVGDSGQQVIIWRTPDDFANRRCSVYLLDPASRSVTKVITIQPPEDARTIAAHVIRREDFYTDPAAKPDPSISRQSLSFSYDAAANQYHVSDISTYNNTSIWENQAPGSSKEVIPGGDYFYGETNRGLVRETNQDTLWMDQSGAAFLVFDGVGGVANGTIASLLAATTASSQVESGVRDVADLVDAIHQAVIMRGADGLTTLVGAIQTAPNTYDVFNVGDSPAYVINADGTVKEVSQRHETPEQRTDENGTYTKYVITRSIGGSQSHQPSIAKITLHLGQRLLLCTDGLADYMDGNATVTAAVSESIRNNSPTEGVKRLIGLANSRGGQDNITAIVVSHKP